MPTYSILSCFQIDKSFLYNISALRLTPPTPLSAVSTVLSCVLQHWPITQHIFVALQKSVCHQESQKKANTMIIRFLGNVLIMFPLRLSYKKIKKLTKTHGSTNKYLY